jgi:hypothetical protein
MVLAVPRTNGRAACWGFEPADPPIQSVANTTKPVPTPLAQPTPEAATDADSSVHSLKKCRPSRGRGIRWELALI